MEGESRLDVHLHPLVLLNMSDHLTRWSCQGSDGGRVVGAIMGKQEMRRVDFHTSFEFLVGIDGKSLNVEYLKERLKQYRTVFPDYEFIGWYAIGNKPNSDDSELNIALRQATGNESPFFLLFNPSADSGEQVPVYVYDSVFLKEDECTFVAQSFTMDTLEAERIAVSHVARTATQATSQYTSDYSSHVSGLANAVSMLSKRVPPLQEYLEQVKAGRLPKDLPVLREIFALCNLIKAQHPEIVSGGDREQLLKDYTDAMLVVYLSSVTKACSHASDLVDKVQHVYDKKNSKRSHHPFQHYMPSGAL